MSINNPEVVDAIGQENKRKTRIFLFAARVNMGSLGEHEKSVGRSVQGAMRLTKRVGVNGRAARCFLVAVRRGERKGPVGIAGLAHYDFEREQDKQGLESESSR